MYSIYIYLSLSLSIAFRLGPLKICLLSRHLRSFASSSHSLSRSSPAWRGPAVQPVARWPLWPPWLGWDAWILWTTMDSFIHVWMPQVRPISEKKKNNDHPLGSCVCFQVFKQTHVGGYSWQWFDDHLMRLDGHLMVISWSVDQGHFMRWKLRLNLLLNTYYCYHHHYNLFFFLSLSPSLSLFLNCYHWSYYRRCHSSSSSSSSSSDSQPL